MFSRAKNMIFLVFVAVLAFSLPVFAENMVIPLQYGQQHTFGVCNGSGSYQVEATAGDRLAVFLTEIQDVGGSCSPGCCCFDQRVKVVQSDGTVLVDQGYVQGNCCGCLGKMLFPEFLVTSTGPVLITIGDNDGFGGGDLGLVVQRLNNPGLIVDNLSGRVEILRSLVPGGLSSYAVTAQTGILYRLEMQAEPNSGVSPRMFLYSSEGRLLDADTDGDHIIHLNAWLNPTFPPIQEIFLLMVGSDSNGSGFYRLSLDIETAVTTKSWSRVKTLYK